MCELNVASTNFHEIFPRNQIQLTYEKKKMKANLNESSRFQLNRTEKTTEKRLLTTSNRATIVCTYEEQHKLAAQKTFSPNLASRQMKTKLYFSS